MSSKSHANPRRPSSHRGGAQPSPQSQAGRAARRAAVVERPFVQKHRGAIIGGLVAAVVVAFVAILVLKGGGSSGPAANASAAPPQLLQQVTQVPATTFDAVGSGSATKSLKPISAPALTSDDKPLVLYVGGEFCPYCAAERWAMVTALSRFGTFDGLKTTASSPTDVFPDTATFSFDGASYTSQYLSFQGVEQFSNQRQGSGYAPLQSLTASQQQTVSTYNADGGIPFVDFGGKYTLAGATYSPGVLAGMSQQQITDALSQTSSAQSQGIIGSANEMTAAICRLTDGQPGNVCQSPGVTAATSLLPQ